MPADYPEPSPCVHVDRHGQTFTYKPGTADQWAEAEIDESEGE